MINTVLSMLLWIVAVHFYLTGWRFLFTQTKIQWRVKYMIWKGIVSCRAVVALKKRKTWRKQTVTADKQYKQCICIGNVVIGLQSWSFSAIVIDGQIVTVEKKNTALPFNLCLKKFPHSCFSLFRYHLSSYMVFSLQWNLQHLLLR